MGRPKIIDEFTDLPISRGQRYRLRYPERQNCKVTLEDGRLVSRPRRYQLSHKEATAKSRQIWRASEGGKAYMKRYRENRKLRNNGP